MASRRPTADSNKGPAPEPRDPSVRIIGGAHRGRKLEYTGDLRTRPMKDRVREAIFNLIGPTVVGAHAVDLFAGTGVLGLEAISRGAAQATLIEQHFPTANLIGRNAQTLGMREQITVVPGNAFIWWRRGPALGGDRWVVFVSPPYEFYVSRQVEMLGLIADMIDAAPTGSVFVVEADERFDMGLLPRSEDWDVRTYLPAVVAIWKKL